jgi:alkanesulfonate monooxygenase SsuD/methylene tetrahydromethanopterin reductase-like flavin-dependent oxidoreductase (luciferase family)
LAPNTDVAAKYTAAVREQAAAAGRHPDDVKFLQGMHFVVGGTEAEANRKAAELEETLDIEALLAHVGGGFGVDLGGLPLDTPLGDLATEGSQGHLEAIRASVRDGNPTLRDIALYRSRANRVVGTPEQIADRLEEWQDAGIDGINIINQTIPGSYTDFIDGVLPELRSRGLAQADYSPGTLREKLFGAGPRLNDRHPAAAFRGAFGEFSASAENKPATISV